MALSKIPIPLLIAALVATTSVTILLQLTVVPVPAVVDDRNFTGVIPKGSPYLFRAAASEITITANTTVKVTYMPLFRVVYINGPPGNVSLGDGRWMIHTDCKRTLLLERMSTANGHVYYLVKLVNASKTNGLSILVPQAFDVTECLCQREVQAVRAFAGANEVYRVVGIYTNGTHIMLSVVPLNNATSTSGPTTHYLRLPPAVNVTSFKITSSGYGVSYKVNGVTVSAYVMPYQHIVIIVPEANARVNIIVR
jgi:hypothetical protein